MHAGGYGKCDFGLTRVRSEGVRAKDLLHRLATKSNEKVQSRKFLRVPSVCVVGVREGQRVWVECLDSYQGSVSLVSSSNVFKQLCRE